MEGGVSDNSTAEKTPFLQRLSQRMRWGNTTKEEKRSLWKGASTERTRRSNRQSGIAVPTETLLQALQRRVVSAAAGEENVVEPEVRELSSLLRLQLRHELMESSLWLVDAFDVLSADAKSSTAAGAAGGSSGARSAELEPLADRFVDGLCGLMQRANFRIFSQRDWQFAQSENFSAHNACTRLCPQRARRASSLFHCHLPARAVFTLPVGVAWEDLDSSAISRLFVRHPHLGLQAAQLARRVLVFHRGAGVAQMTSFFLEEKLDMLIDRLFTDPFRRLISFFQRRACPERAARAATTEAGRNREREVSTWEADGQTQRINLTRALPTIWKLVRRFFRKLTVQEPTLQDVVVFYTEVRYLLRHCAWCIPPA